MRDSRGGCRRYVTGDATTADDMITGCTREMRRLQLIHAVRPAVRGAAVCSKLRLAGRWNVARIYARECGLTRGRWTRAINYLLQLRWVAFWELVVGD